MFKIALNAARSPFSAGCRCIGSIDPNKTKEWTLNNRICEKIENRLCGYSGYELLRLDDPSGKKHISQKRRTAAANRWGAHIYISVGHSLGMRGGRKGGISVCPHSPADEIAAEWSSDFSSALVRHTGLKNRKEAVPKEIYTAAMPAVMLKCGFMDSVSDTPVILTEDYADRCADAISEVLIRRCGLESIDRAAPFSGSMHSVPDVKYRVYTEKSGWLPEVSNGQPAGRAKQPVRYICAKLSAGELEYCTHTRGGRWLGWVKAPDSYSGLAGKDIDCIRLRLIGRPDCSVQYRVSPVGGEFYGWVTDNSDYAGIYGKKIDRIEIKITKK